MMGSIKRTLSAAVLAAGIVTFCVSTVSVSHAGEAPDLSVSPELQGAIDLWLADKDEEALPRLSELAAAGDRTAGLFLSLVERNELGTSDFVLSQDRDGYLSLFRAPGGKGPFRKTWVDTFAREGEVFAAQIKKSWLPNPALEEVLALLKLGEPGVAMIGVRYIGLYGTREDRTTLLESGLYLQGMIPFLRTQQLDPAPDLQGLEALREIAAQTSGRSVPPDDADAQALAPYLSIGFPFATVAPDNSWRDDLVDWIATAEEARPVAVFCDQHCPAEKGACGLSVMGLIGGYYGAIRYSSPLRSVISHADYAQSPRASGMILRHLISFENEAGDTLLASVPEIAKQSQCVADLVDHHRQELAQRE